MQENIPIIYWLQNTGSTQINTTSAWDQLFTIILERRINYSIKYNGNNVYIMRASKSCVVNEMHYKTKK